VKRLRLFATVRRAEVKATEFELGWKRVAPPLICNPKTS